MPESELKSLQLFLPRRPTGVGRLSSCDGPGSKTVLHGNLCAWVAQPKRSGPFSAIGWIPNLLAAHHPLCSIDRLGVKLRVKLQPESFYAVPLGDPKLFCFLSLELFFQRRRLSTGVCSSIKADERRDDINCSTKDEERYQKISKDTTKLMAIRLPS